MSTLTKEAIESKKSIISPPTGKTFRWGVVALLFFATTINYLDRQILGYLKPTLEGEFHWTETDYSQIITTFSIFYTVGYLIFGVLIDKLGTKLGYIISLIVWCIAAVYHAAVRSTLGFHIARATLGLGEAGNFPAAIKSVAEWFPKKERALATGIFNSGANIGAVLAPIIVPWLLYSYGWRAAFWITGAIGFIWLIFWIIYYQTPSKHKKISKEEFEYIHSDVEPVDTKPEEKSIKWSKLLSIRQTWAFVIGKFMTDPIWWFFLFWLPSYFSSTFNLDLKKPSMELALIYSLTTIGSIGGGYLSSYLIKKNWPIFKARKTTMLVFAIAVTPIILIQFATSIWTVVFLIGIAAAAHQAWSANIFTTASDMFPKKAVSSVIGIGGMAGSTGSILFPMLVGAVLDHYKLLGNITIGYNLLFVICGCMYLLAWLIMHILVPKHSVVKI
jgi:MFS transporter, ACS family, hexuronate transporter